MVVTSSCDRAIESIQYPANCQLSSAPWTPDLAKHKGPRYRAIADALADDVRAGRLKEGARLPTHRDLAGTLRVTVGTISRAYAEAERRGLIRGEVGRGTFVHPDSGGRAEFGMKTSQEPSLIDLSLNFPVSEAEDRAARLIDRMIPALGATTWMAAPLLAELAASLIEDGTAGAILKSRRKEAEARQDLAAKILRPSEAGAHPHGFHLWLPLPEPWRGEDFAAKARQRGVAVNPGEVFVAGVAKPPAAVRVCLGAARTRDRLEKGLWILRDVLGGAGQRDLAIV